jgi:DNA-binding transcriptional ArsR family regulator
MGYVTEWFITMTATSPDRLSATFSALADPTRRAILARLALGETTVNELAKPFKMSGPAVSKHLKVLERAGLIGRSRDAQTRPCKLEAIALKGVDDWLGEYRKLWEQRLDRLEDYLKALQAKKSTQTNKETNKQGNSQAREPKRGGKK